MWRKAFFSAYRIPVIGYILTNLRDYMNHIFEIIQPEPPTPLPSPPSPASRLLQCHILNTKMHVYIMLFYKLSKIYEYTISMCKYI